MGSCVSVHKGAPESAMKLRMPFGSKADKFVIPESPIKDKQTTGGGVKTFKDAGSKDETFFDSQPWLESDCEDDFYSVNGEFTPSRGNTPVHHNFSTPKVNKIPLDNKSPGSMPEPSPNRKKKRLSELFRESIRDGEDVDDQETSGNGKIANENREAKPAILDVLPKSTTGTPFMSGASSVCSSERTANGDALMEREKSMKSTQCCLPSLVSCTSFSERRKEKMSPSAIAVNDKA